jgi:hypothetical protein
MSRRASRILPPLLAVLSFTTQACGGADPVVDIQAGSLAISVSRDGRLAALTAEPGGRDYLPAGTRAPILTLRVGGEDRTPESASFLEADSVLVLDYGEGLEARILVRSRATHATFEIAAVSELGVVDVAIWGPYPTTIDGIIGETVGVVRGEEHAIGLQALNPRTLGGYPWRENDAMPQLDIFESGDFSDLSEEGKRYVLYRVEAAKPDSLGSTLQAYTRSRHGERIIPNWGHER